MHMRCTCLAQVGTPLLALLEGEARQRGPTQADVLAAADLLVRRLLRGVALEAERAALRHGEAHAVHEEAAAATVVAAEGGEGAAAERAGERGGEPEAAALRKALAAQGEALRRAEAAGAEREEYERVPRPRGRAPKGKRWDDRHGCWVADGATVAGTAQAAGRRSAGTRRGRGAG